MKFQSTIFILFIILDSMCYGQNKAEQKSKESDGNIIIDSTIYSRDYRFNNGAYRSYKEFKFNSPSILYAKERGIIEQSNKNDTNLIVYSDYEDFIEKLKDEKVWGYAKGGEVYVWSHVRLSNSFAKFLKIDFFGEMMLASTEIIEFDVITEEGYSATARTDEAVAPILIDGRTGDLFSYNTSNFDKVLKRDENLYKEFRRIKYHERKNMMFIYLKKFNKKHPFYLMSATYK